MFGFAMVVEGDFVVEVKSTVDNNRYVVFNSDQQFSV
jgi:hypothetical protein